MKKKNYSTPADLSFKKFLDKKSTPDYTAFANESYFAEWLGELKTNPNLDFHVMEHKLFTFLIDAVQEK